MSPVRRSKGLFPCQPLAFALALIFFPFRDSAEIPPLRIRPTAEGAELSLPSTPVAPVVGTRYRLGVQRSTNLCSWGPSIDLKASTNPAAPFTLTVGNDAMGFYRLDPQVEDSGGATDGAELFGYNRVFTQTLNSLGFPPVDDFRKQFQPTNQYLPLIQFDPTTAKYWTEFNTDPAVFNASLPTNSPDRRLHDFRLDSNEFSAFRTNGFVVSERLGYVSFADAYYAIFNDDLPLFITTDSVLEAWHKSYESMLSELEETQLMGSLQDLLYSMQWDGLRSLTNSIQGGVLADSLKDADYFLSVANSLLSGIPPLRGVLGSDVRTDAALKAIGAGSYVSDFTLWDKPRGVDFSQFIPRGKYTHTLQSQRYFRAVKWLGLANLRIAGSGSSPRELGTALILQELYSRTNPALWDSIDDVVTQFVGRTDTLTFRELGPLRTAAKLDLVAASNPARLQEFQNALMAGSYGVQNYANEAIAVPFGKDQLQMPRVFSTFGARFILDGWATSQLTFGNVRWEGSPIPSENLFGGRVLRRLPTALDVAFGVFGNDQVTDSISDEIQRTQLPYHHNLTAVRKTVDQLSPATWQESIYNRWLYALRTLSTPITDPRYPQAMRTRAWAHKTVNTQLASWTELRHDTVLYAAQPVSGIVSCEYPAGFVEPRIEFWNAMRNLALETAKALGQLPASGNGFGHLDREFGNPIYFSSAAQREARIAHCTEFASVMESLAEMSRKELAGIPFTSTETALIKGTMNSQTHPYFGATYDGWFPGLFYKDVGQLGDKSVDTKPAGKSPILVTDVHTAPADALYDGGVLHEGVGGVDLILIAVDNGPDRMVYAGPTLSHYEFVEGPGVKRLTDSDWYGRLVGTNKPARPSWTRDYLVPK
jgi:hypothetical protein